MKPAIYDTRTFVRNLVDIRQGVLFGLVSILLGWFAQRITQPFLSTTVLALSAGVLYFAILALPFRSQLLVLLLHSVLLFIGVEPVWTLRTVSFGALLIPATFSKTFISSFFTLILLWGALLVWNAGWLPAPPLSLPSGLGRLFVFESSLLLLSTVLLWSEPITQLLKRERRTVDLSSMVMVIVFLGVLACTLLVGRAALELTQNTFAELLARISIAPYYVIAAALSVVTIPILVGVALSQVMQDFIHQLHELSNPTKRFFQPRRGVPLLREFQNSVQFLRILLDGALHSAREANIRVKELHATAEQKEREIRRREIDSENLERLMNAAPLGYLAITGAGAVITVNRRFFELTAFPEQKLLGEHISTLRAESEYQKEILGKLGEVLRRHRELLASGRYKSYAPGPSGTYFELEFRITKTKELELVETVSSEMLSPSHLAITLFIRVIPDLRAIQQTLLFGTPAQILGYQAVDLVKNLRRVFQQIAKLQNLKQFQRFLDNPHADPEIALCLRDLQELSNQAYTESEQFELRAAERCKELERFDLLEVFQGGLTFLGEVLALDSVPRIVVEEPEQTPESSRHKREHQRVAVITPFGEFEQLYAAVLSVIQGMLRVTEEIELSLGYEQIGAGTSTIIPGSSPGEYARITLTHPGQSITANMLQNALRSVNLRDPGEIDTGIQLLSLAIQRLNGFLSVQSSPAKGTTLTIYIPEEPGKVERRPRSLERREQPTSSYRGSALIVGISKEVVSTITKQLEAIGLRVTEELPLSEEDVLSDEDFSFGGAGFGESSPVAVEKSPPSLSARSADYDLVILELSGEHSAAQEIIKLVQHPRVICIGGIETPPGAIPLEPPVMKEVLERAVNKLLALTNSQ